MTTSDTDRIVSVEWGDRDLISIHLEQDWQSRCTPSALLDQLTRQLLRTRGGAARPSHDISGVPLHQLKEYANLLREARAERTDRRREPVTTASAHLRCRWDAAGFAAITGDLDWLGTAARQAIVDELHEVLTPPSSDDSSHRPAAARLGRFMKEYPPHG